MSEDKLKITFLLRSLEAGGAERLICNMAEGLKKRGHEVTVITFYPGGHFSDELSDKGITHRNAGKKSRWDTLGFAWRLRSCLRSNSPDVIYSFLPMPNIVLALMKPFLGRSKIVWGSGALNQVSQFHDRLSRLSLWAETRFSGVPDLIIANSVPVKNALISKGIDASNLVLVPNGVNTDIFMLDHSKGDALRSQWGIDATQTIIGRVGRLHPVKGYETFLRASAHVNSSNVKFVIVGDGNKDYAQELRKLADELGIADRVLWAGTYQDMTAVYNAFDLTVSSSVEESSPHVAIEGMACGIPSIVTDVGDSSELVNNTALVVPPEDPQSMAQAIDAFIVMNDSHKTALGKELRQRMIDHYSEKNLISNIEKLFMDLAGKTYAGGR